MENATTLTKYDLQESMYDFKAVAHGTGGSSSAECDVFLFISDRNDNAPKFSSDVHEVEIQEDVPLGHVVLQVEVDDLDTS